MLERINIKNLGADVAVQAAKMNALHFERFTHALQRFTRFQSEAKFGVNLPRANKAVCVRINTGLNAEHDIGLFARMSRKII